MGIPTSISLRRPRQRTSGRSWVVAYEDPLRLPFHPWSETPALQLNRRDAIEIESKLRLAQTTSRRQGGAVSVETAAGEHARNPRYRHASRAEGARSYGSVQGGEGVLAGRVKRATKETRD